MTTHPPAWPPPWATRRDAAVHSAVQAGLVSSEDPLAAFVDLRGIAETAQAIKAAWPERLDVRHTFAAKANSLVPILRIIRGHGLGCEVASAGEFAQALAAGFPAREIVFDSPAKTQGELAEAIRAGIAINADNFQELDRIDAILKRESLPSLPNIGVRINPQVGVGDIEAVSTAGAQSKFGIALRDDGAREELLDAFTHHPWLRWIHVHVGSQGSPIKLIAEGISAAVELAEEVNRSAGERRVAGIDIGGGVSVDFEGEDAPDFAGHAAAAFAAAPALARGEFQLVTEFGRSVMAKNGFMASTVEYTKSAGGRRIAVTHAGAHVATRTTLAPEAWPLRVFAYDAEGLPKIAATVEQDIAGPCCFAGDLVASARELPLLEQDDIIAVADTGAYNFSAPYRYNSLPMPAVYGFEITEDGDVHFSTLRRAETVADLVREAGGALG